MADSEARGERPPAAFERSFLRFLPAAAREPLSAERSILTGWATAFFPSILLAGLAAVLAPDLGRPEFPARGAMLLFLLVVFSPFLETLIMAAGIELFRLALAPPAAVVASALSWAAVHSFAAPAWGLVIWWPFLIFSTLYLAWLPLGRARAVSVVFITHGLQNLPVALLLLWQT